VRRLADDGERRFPSHVLAVFLGLPSRDGSGEPLANFPVIRDVVDLDDFMEKLRRVKLADSRDGEATVEGEYRPDPS